MKTTTFFFLFFANFFPPNKFRVSFFFGGALFFRSLFSPLENALLLSSAHIISSIWCRPFKVVREEKHHHVCDDDGGGGGDIISPDECWQCCLEERGRAFEYEQSVAL